MQNRFLWFLVGVSLAWLALSLIYDNRNPRPDFAHDYAAGLLVRTGKAGMIYSLDESDTLTCSLMPQELTEPMRARGYDGPYITRFFSHPFYAILMVPFTFLPYYPASALFLGLQIVLSCLVLLAIFRGREPWQAVLAITVFLLFYPARHGLEIGQGTGFLIPVAAYFILRPKKALSQVGLALGFLLKPALLILPLLFLTERRWRGLLIFTGTWLLASVAAILLFGKNVFLQYLGLLIQRANLLYIGAENQSALAVLYRLFVGTSEHAELNTALAVVPFWLRAINWAWAGAVLGLTGWRLWRTSDPLWRGNTLLLASLLIVPFASTHYFGLALVPLLFLAISRARPLSYLLAGVAFLLMEVPRAYYTGGPALRFLCVNLFVGALVLFIGYLIGPEHSRAFKKEPETIN